MAKEVMQILTLQLPAGKANPAPPVGPALGQHGVNIMEFCKAFNAKTQDKAGWIIPVEISVFSDRSFTFILKTPPASDLLKKATGITTAAKNTNAKLKELAETKMPDLNASSIETAMKIIAGSARSMGIKIED